MNGGMKGDKSSVKVHNISFRNESCIEKGFSVTLLQCIAHDEIKRVLKEVHEGECGDHNGGQALAKKYLVMDIID